MGLEPYEESRTRAQRTFRKGHAMRKVSDGPGSTDFKIICEGVDDQGVPCGWYTFGSYAMPEPAEEAAYLHRTQPALLIPNSSDIMAATRIAETRAKPFRER
jgi:hypothetical protein